jgi:uncharacterized protein YraI
VTKKHFFHFLLFLLLSSGCGMNISTENTPTAAAGFVTSTLPPTKIPPATHTPLPATPSGIAAAGIDTPIISFVEGTTTTQLNVRAETSTASKSLGTISQFSKVQIIGRDASGSWYQIFYAGSESGNGWVRAEYVQVNAGAEIPLIGSLTGSGAGVSGLVILKINIRKGPGIQYESLGVLNPKDVVFITGKAADGEWVQIEFSSAEDGRGWAAVKYLEIEGLESVPIIDSDETPAVTPNLTPAPATVVSPAPEDGDSMQSPAVVVVFSASGVKALQVAGEISSPQGDAEDWAQFISYTTAVSVEVNCSGGVIRMESWSAGQLVENLSLACGGSLIIKTSPGQPYLLRLQAGISGGPFLVSYTLKVSVIE